MSERAGCTGGPIEDELEYIPKRKLASLRSQLSKSEAAREKAMRALATIIAYLKTRRWLVDGLGPYQYNDPRFRDEIDQTFIEIKALAEEGGK